MIKYLLFIPFLFSALYSGELDWVKEQVRAIKPPRSGLTKSDVLQIKNPFLFVVQDDKKKKGKEKTKKKVLVKHSQKQVVKKKPKDSFKLEAVINKSALINGKWYKQGSKIGAFKLAKVEMSSITLKGRTKKVVLSITTKNKNLNFTSRNK